MCVHRGKFNDESLYSDQSLYWTVFNDATGNWDVDRKFSRGNRSISAPALAMYRGTLYCVHRGQQGDDHLWWTTFERAAASGPRTDDSPTTIAAAMRRRWPC
jgi:hypothetical protein